jgi:hypothetical protein
MMQRSTDPVAIARGSVTLPFVRYKKEVSRLSNSPLILFDCWLQTSGFHRHPDGLHPDDRRLDRPVVRRLVCRPGRRHVGRRPTCRPVGLHPVYQHLSFYLVASLPSVFEMISDCGVIVRLSLRRAECLRARVNRSQSRCRTVVRESTTPVRRWFGRYESSVLPRRRRDAHSGGR